MKLSEHFDSDEFKCHCCGKLTIDPKLIEQLELLRQELDNHPITINSGYRCKRNNQLVKGVPNSQHTLGKAADIRVAGFTPEQVAKAAEKVGFTGIGVYNNFTHLDVRPNPARWDNRGN